MTGPKSQYARLAAKLRQQLTFLRRSCDAYDTGVEDESIRIASAMRIIFHDKGRSTSLMTHLGLKVTKMLSSSRGLGDWKDFLDQTDFRSPQPIHMVPLLGDRFIELQLDEWWNNQPVFNHDGVPYSRRMISLSAAEKDGGAHVDEELERYYQVLSQESTQSGYKVISSLTVKLHSHRGFLCIRQTRTSRFFARLHARY